MILTLVTHDRGIIEETAFQALTFARSLSEDLGVPHHAAWIGDFEVDDRLADFGVSTIHQIGHDGLDDYSAAAWGSAVAQLTDSISPTAVVAVGSDGGNEVMSNVGALTGLPMVANVREVTTGDSWTIVRTRWGGSLLEETSLDAPIKLLTVTEHAVEAAPAETGATVETVAFSPDLSEGDLVTQVVDRVVTSGGITLTTAPVVVSGGRGVGSPDGFAPLEELAGLLGGVVGCSRVVTNNGWRPHSDQVGQTGTVVAPDVYIACGISGAIQHWVGMMASKTIIAINTDAEAPMVTKADYAVVGDLGEVVPAIVEELKSRQSTR
ncbi:MAG TPA: electron transfer flavoprotein subunit alpha/FixB family protein [Acidimicrobiia bacterium]|nr:electron transfer flavoprotein subunit alpha/FixB family protein [Acidimicrobiia bacterium]